MNQTTSPDTVDGSKAIRQSFREDVLAGLARSPKCISAKHIYDARGSELFESICQLDEYYLTRTERSILEEHLPDIAAAIGPRAVIIEPGAGSGEKAEQLLEGLDDPDSYVPIEISRAALRSAVERIRAAFPELTTQPIVGDFTRGEAMALEGPSRHVIFFPGSTIGNFERNDRIKLWNRFAAMAGDDGAVLVGFDLVKSTDILIPAYNDSEGVTAAFNTNLLHRINNELAGSLDLASFSYDCRWNEELQCIEMGQRSTKAQTIEVAGKAFELDEDELIRTERSHKFTLEKMDGEAAEAGFTRIAHWTDPRKWFCVGLYQVAQVKHR